MKCQVAMFIWLPDMFRFEDLHRLKLTIVQSYRDFTVQRV